MKLIQNEKNLTILKIRSDKGTKFLNSMITSFCEEHGIKHQTSTARTPQQNVVSERRNRTLKEATRMMISKAGLPQRFWDEDVNIACYT